MGRFGWVVGLGCLLLLAEPTLAQRATPETFAPLVERLLPGVVNIATTQVLPGPERRSVLPPAEPGTPSSPFEEFFRDFLERQQRDPNGAPRRGTSLGSGFLIDTAGHIVTNLHVIEDAEQIQVRLHDDSVYKAKLVGQDKATDLALLKIDATVPLHPLVWGDSSQAKVGDWVVAIGNPFGLGGTVTAGIISARARDIGAGNYDDFLQTDAAINRGNSGGPLLNMQGQVIGINTVIFSQSGGSVGIGFAIPAALARTVAEQLQKSGTVRRGWLGVQFQDVTQDIADSLGLKQPKGVLIGSVAGGSPAETAGIQPGDVILNFAGHEVTGGRGLSRLVAETAVDQAVPVDIWRRGDQRRVTVKIGELQEAVAAAEPAGQLTPTGPQSVQSLGMTLSMLDATARQRYQLSASVRGIVVTAVTNEGPAAERGMREGDVIVEVSQEEVTTPSDVVDRVAKARKAGQRALLLLIERKGELQFLALPLAG